MPNRIIREDFITSEIINSLDEGAECFFFRLMLKADDYGRFTANTKLLKSALYPLKDDVRDTDIARKLAAAEQAGLVRCYEVDNKRYLEIRKFGQRVRGASKYPSPPTSADNGAQVPAVGGLGVCVVEGEDGGGGGPQPPLLANAMAWLENARKQGADYAESEVKSAFLSLAATGWMWGKNKVVDWRSALESRIQWDRDHKPSLKAKPRAIAP